MNKLYTSSKRYAPAIGLIVLALGVVAFTAFLVPFFYNTFNQTSYRFVIVFLLIIIVSNVLAKIAYKYIQL